MNTFIGIGHVVNDAATRTVSIGGVPTLVTDFTVAVNEGYGDAQKTDYVRCTLWRERGAKLAQYLVKGRQVTVKGAISAQAWIATKGENAGKAMCQLVMSNPAVELEGRKPEQPEEPPFIPDEA
jgi:single-strand DNA-binding protein